MAERKKNEHFKNEKSPAFAMIVQEPAFENCDLIVGSNFFPRLRALPLPIGLHFGLPISTAAGCRCEEIVYFITE